eukprot:418677-Hanusia_phi.AAC.1
MPRTRGARMLPLMLWFLSGLTTTAESTQALHTLQYSMVKSGSILWLCTLTSSSVLRFRPSTFARAGMEGKWQILSTRMPQQCKKSSNCGKDALKTEKVVPTDFKMHALHIRGGEQLSADRATFKFRVKVEQTKPGESVVLLGAVDTMGSWDKSKALKLETSTVEFPWWHGEATVPKGEDIEYKFAIVGATGFTWENGCNRVLNIPLNKDQLELNALVFGQAERENSDSESQAYEYETPMYHAAASYNHVHTVTTSDQTHLKEKSVSRMHASHEDPSLQQDRKSNVQSVKSSKTNTVAPEVDASSNQNLPAVKNASLTENRAVNKKSARFLSALKTGLGILTLPITIPVGGVFALCMGLCNLVYRTLSSISAMMFDHSSEEFEKVLIKTVQNMEVTMRKMERSLIESEEAVKRRVQEIKDLEQNYAEEHDRYLHVLQERNASENSFVSIAAALRKDLTEIEETASKSLQRSKDEYTAYFENIKQEMAQSLSKFSRDLQDLGSSTLTESQKLRSSFDDALTSHSKRLQESMDLCMKFDNELSHTRKHVKVLEGNLEKMIDDQSQRVEALKAEVCNMQSEYRSKFARVTDSSDKLTSQLSQAQVDLNSLKAHNTEMHDKIVNISESSRLMIPQTLSPGQNMSTRAQHIEFVRNELNKVRRFHAEEIDRLESMINALSATAPPNNLVYKQLIVDKHATASAKEKDKKLSDFDKLASFCSNSASESDHHEAESQVLHPVILSEALKVELKNDTAVNAASHLSNMPLAEEITSREAKEGATTREHVEEVAEILQNADETTTDNSPISIGESPIVHADMPRSIENGDAKLEMSSQKASEEVPYLAFRSDLIISIAQVHCCCAR